MKVLLINAGSLCVSQTPIMPLGLLSIATFLSNNGHEVKLIDRTVEKCNVKRVLESYRPDVVGISAITFMSFSDAIKISELVKKFNIPVVWGGQIPSLAPELVIDSKVVDYVVIGDGEIAMLELMDAIRNKASLRAVDGLVFIENNEIIINKDREMVDLSMLPIIDFNFVDPNKYIVENVSCKRSLHIYSSKGCPGQCTYCYSPCFSKRLWRARPMMYVLSEIRYLIQNYNLDGVYFADDLISPNGKYLFEFCKGLRESDLKFFWGCNLRADSCTKEELQMLFDSGCRWIFFGIESGTRERQKTIKKNLDLTKARQNISACKEIGITTTTSVIIGYPDETEKELKETIEYMLSLDSDVIIASMYGVIPKSELYDYLIENKRMEVPGSYQEWEKLKWLDKLGKNFSEVSGRDLKVIANWFTLSIIVSKSGKSKEDSHFWLKRLLRQAFGYFKAGTLKSLSMFFLAGFQFLQILYYAKMFPKTLKKYGLSN